MFSRLKDKKLLYGFLVAPIFMIIYLVYSAHLGRSDPTYVGSLCMEKSCECADWFRRSVDHYQIENNVWNKKNIKSYQQCVFINENNNGMDAGWAWNWPGIRFNVVAYPNITYGKNPWLPSTSPELPLRIDEIKCLEANIDVIQTGSGKGNLSFDLWITNNLSSNPSSITHEVMIWLSHEGLWPAGSQIDTIDIDGNEIEVWKKENHNPSDDYQWTFLGFVYQADLMKGSINFYDFLQYLVRKGHIATESYLAGI
jgi:hypothetical protein